MKSYQKWNNIIGWLVFIAASFVYIATAEPTASWWDCGEYIATSYKMEIGHPPGAPMFQILGRIFSLFASDTTQVAFMINVMSALSSSFTILFLFWSISLLGKKIVLRNSSEISQPQAFAILGSALVGAFAYTFSDTFWFSAVEGEVYAMSSFFTAIVFWAILKWDSQADDKHSIRWLILIAFLIGLSIGVHLLNLLAIPAIFYIYYFRKFKVTKKGFILTGLLSVVMLAFILYGLIPDVVNLFSKVEVFFVNSLGAPFNLGTVIFALTLIATLITGILYTAKPNSSIMPFAISGGVLILWVFLGTSSVGSFFIRAIICAALVWGIYKLKDNRNALQAIFLSFAFFFMGYSTFLTLVIRSNANTPINQNHPKDAVSLLTYLNREQYGEAPVFYGPYFTEDPIEFKGFPEKYVRGVDKYETVEVKSNPQYKYADKSCTVFPRMFSRDTERNHPQMYKVWGSIKSDRKPSFSENVKYYVRYQLNFMYWRYFMWNFAGRQNDIQGHGYYTNGIRDIHHGNWISGVNFIDEARLGPQNNLPDDLANNRGRNAYYFLPLILGLIGLFYHYKKSKKDMFVVFLLFFMTGLAIATYLNTPPMQPRERDYAYAGSFYAFAIWIGLGVLALYEYSSKKLPKTAAAVGLTTVCFIAVPALMASNNWDDHDRSQRTAARDFAINSLSTCDKDAIYITYGDNDTFPLWYIQEVEGYRTDVRILNYTLAGMSWYTQQLFYKVYESDPLPFTLKYEQYGQGKNEEVGIKKMTSGEHIPLKDILEFVKSEIPESKFRTQMGNEISVFPTNRVQLSVNKEDLVKRGIITEDKAALVPETISWVIDRNGIRINELMFLDFMATNNWNRSVYVNPYYMKDIFPAEQYVEMVGQSYKIVPYPNTQGQYRYDVEKTFELYTNKNTKWGNLNNPKVYVDPISLNNASLARRQYLNFANYLQAVGKKDSALVVLNKGLEFFPDKTIPYDYTVAHYAYIYGTLGHKDKAKQILNRMLDIYTKNLLYCQSVKGKLAISTEPIRQEASHSLDLISKIVDDLGADYSDIKDRLKTMRF